MADCSFSRCLIHVNNQGICHLAKFIKVPILWFWLQSSFLWITTNFFSNPSFMSGRTSATLQSIIAHIRVSKRSSISESFWQEVLSFCLLPSLFWSSLIIQWSWIHMLRFNFILGLNSILFCFWVYWCLIMSLKQKKITLKPRIKLNHNIYINIKPS